MWENDKKTINSARDLEDLLNDPLAHPEPLPYALLEKITSGFNTRLGSGGYGDVYLGVLGNDKKVAVKGLVYTETDETGTDELLRREIDCFMRAKNDNIARLLGYSADIARKMTLDTDGANSFTQCPRRYLCLEYASNGDLQAYIDGSDGDDWTTYYQMIMGVCHGLEHIHKQQIIHLDLKPKNILLDAYMRTKITDFGVSILFAEGKSTDIVKRPPGTEGFQAPEMQARNEVSYKSDIYALGATIARLLMRKNSGSAKKWLVESSTEENCPNEKKRFIDIALSCMEDQPDDRITLQEIIVQLKEMGLNDLKIPDSEGVIKVVPHEMLFRAFDRENVVSSTLNLVNRTRQTVAYKISRKGSGEEHSTGIIIPRSTHTVNMPRDASETFRVQSTIVTKHIKKEDIPVDLFEMEVPGRRIYEVDVCVVVEPWPLEGFNTSQLKGDGAPGDTCLQVMHGSTPPLNVRPSELHIPFEPNKCIPCLLHLTNSTDRLMGFNIRCGWVFNGRLEGSVPPRSTYSLVVVSRRRTTLPVKEYETQDVMTVKSGFCDDYSIVHDFVYSLELKVVYTLPGEMTYEQANPHGMKIISTMVYLHELEYVSANPREPWVATVKSAGHLLHITNYETQKPPVQFNLTLPYEGFSPKFIAQEELIMVPSRNDGYIDMYDYKMRQIGGGINVGIKSVTTLAVHPTKRSVLSIHNASKQMKLWDWDEEWKLTRIFNTGKVLCFLKQVVFNPKNTKYNSLASGWNDHTIMFWDLDSSECSHTLFGHEDKVHSVDFFTRDNQEQYLISGSEDKTAKIWDMQDMTLVHTLEGFMSPVVCVYGHPNLPLLITGTNDGIVHVWSSTDFGLKSIFDKSGHKNVLSLALACPVGSNRVVIGQAHAVSILDFGNKADIKKDGQRELETSEFGEQKVSCLPVSLEKRCPPEKNNNQVRVQEPLVSQPSLGSSSVAAVLATGSDGPTTVPSINEIEQLLSKVDKLAQKVPTTGERLSRISRIFPPGRGPCVEAVQEATNYDVDVLESLKLATFYIRDSFVKLGKKQDAICSEFERKAVFIEGPKNEQDDTVAVIEEPNSGESSGDNQGR